MVPVPVFSWSYKLLADPSAVLGSRDAGRASLANKEYPSRDFCWCMYDDESCSKD